MKKNKGQSILEYALVIACITAALISMQIYLKRGFSGRLKESADNLGSQYDPKNTTSSSETNLTSNTYSVAEVIEDSVPRFNKEKGIFEEQPGRAVIRTDFIINETMDTTKRECVGRGACPKVEKKE